MKPRRPLTITIIGSLLLSLWPALTALSAATNDVFEWLNPTTLKVKDALSEQHYRWEKGVLTLLRTKSVGSATEENYHQPIPLRSPMGEPRTTSHKITRIAATERTSAYTRLDLHANYDSCEIVRSLLVYDDAPAGIEWRLALRGCNRLFAPQARTTENELLEDPALLNAGNMPHYFALPLPQPHVTTHIVAFCEATDHHTNPVNLRSELPYRKTQRYRGNMLMLTSNAPQTANHLIVKLSPLQQAQSAYTGFDFTTDFSGIRVHSPGFQTPAENEPPTQEAYPVFLIMYAHDADEALRLYKRYELAVHRYLPEKDNTLTVNTWGDRNKDSRVNEHFVLNELDAAAALGITHYQIDDGWQQGLSQNSSKKEGVLWNDWSNDDWQVNIARFPRGLKPVIDKTRALRMELGLWFNPSKAANYAAWERDRDILLNLHRTHAVSWIKIDGLEIGNKTAETNVARMLFGAQEASQGLLQFNMDVTAGKRGGYFYFHRLGSLFLENRYTDWGNYYPHLTLRNLWQLSKYIPAQRIQIEWLNKWRNADKYPADDPLRPQNVPFDYLFAITMMGQSLAWFEVTGLPQEAFGVVPLIQTWKEERGRMQQGVIHPVGEIPDGYSFPGFVSQADGRIYVLLFREYTASRTGRYQLPFKIGEQAKFVRLGGNGRLKVTGEHLVEVDFSNPFQFVWGYFGL